MSDYAILSGSDRVIWWQWVRGLLVLGAIAAGIVTTEPHPARFGRGLAMVVLVAACVIIRLPVIFRARNLLLLNASILAMGLAGTALTLVSPHSAAIAFAAFGVGSAVQRWPLPVWAGFAIGLSLVYVLGQLALGGSYGVIDLGPAVFVAAVLVGMVRRQNAVLIAESAQVLEEKARSAALDERARIAREIHDVLAHALSALSLQLESADALLEAGRVEQAHASVLRASKLAREGMAETRRAVSALRGDTLPIPELLTGLTRAYEMDLGGTASVRIEGEPRDLRPDVGLTVYRTAQEAITNIRKHAPGAAIAVKLHYGPDEVALEVVNGAAPGPERPLTGTGGGYGLTGLRERAELAGGRFEAAPTTERPTTEHSTTEQPTTERLIAQQPTAGKQPTTDDEPNEGPTSSEEVNATDVTAGREGWRVSVRIPA